MSPLTFATTNSQKFLIATTACAPFGVTLAQKPGLHIVEIQSESGEPVAAHKVHEAFSLLQCPVVVTDDTWIIPGLRGFPGPYMSSVNQWFTAKDWLRLTQTLIDRRVILRQIIAYEDAGEQQIFTADIEGVLLKEIRGTSAKANQPVFSMDGGITSIAEAFARGESAIAHRTTAWHEFAPWFKAHKLES